MATMEMEYQREQGQMEMETMQTSFHKIEELEQYGINKTDIMKLKTGGYHTIEAVGRFVFKCSKFIGLVRLRIQRCVN